MNCYSEDFILKSIKYTHTAVWALFVTCILAVWVFAWRGAFHSAALLIDIVLIEVVVLILNRWRCPLGSLARALHRRPARQLRHLSAGMARPSHQADLRHALCGRHPLHTREVAQCTTISHCSGMARMIDNAGSGCPAAVYALALRLGANPEVNRQGVYLEQSGRMKPLGATSWMSFTAKQTISTAQLRIRLAGTDRSLWYHLRARCLDGGRGAI